MTYQYGSEDAKSWTLRGIDPGFEVEFKGQYISTNMEETIGSDLGETSTVNKEQPDYQWVKGIGDQFTFSTRLFAEHQFQNVRQQVELLKSYAKRNKNLKRVPRFIFSAGTEISFVCFIRLARFLYDELRPDGSLQGAIINITLQPIDPDIAEDSAKNMSEQITQASGVKSASPNIKRKAGKQKDVPGSSLHTFDKEHLVKSGETFESIAAMRYGNALVGDILRRSQPEMIPLEPGDKIDLMEASEVRRIIITPQSIPLKRTIVNEELRKTVLERKNETVRIFI